MEIFFSILFKILPLYIFVGIGFIAGKYLNIDARGIGGKANNLYHSSFCNF